MTDKWAVNENAALLIVNISQNHSGTDQERQSTAAGLVLYNTLLWIVLYGIAVLLNVFCNISALVVFLAGRRSRTDLRPFLLSLACSDLQMGVFCIPFTSTYTLMNFNWVFPRAMCKAVLFFQHSAVASSVFTNMAIGVDRLLAVMLPFQSHLAGARAKVALTIIWIAASCLSSVQLQVGDKFYDSTSGNWRCEELPQNWPEPHATFDAFYTWFLFSVTYAIPLFVLTITYLIVGVKLWRRIAPGNANAQRDSRQLRGTIKVVKMLAAIVTCFGFNWLPIYLFFILQKSCPQIRDFLVAYPIIALNAYNCSHWLAMSNSFCNFWIYFIMNEAFRADFFVLICRSQERCSKNCCKTTASQFALDESTIQLNERDVAQKRLQEKQRHLQSIEPNSAFGMYVDVDRSVTSASSVYSRSRFLRFSKRNSNGTRKGDRVCEKSSSTAINSE